MRPSHQSRQLRSLNVIVKDIPCTAEITLILCSPSRRIPLFDDNPHYHRHTLFKSRPSIACQLSYLPAFVDTEIVLPLFHQPSLNSIFDGIGLKQNCNHIIELLKMNPSVSFLQT